MHSTASRVLIRDWSEKPLLVLGFLLTGVIPLSASIGLSIGLAASHATWGWRVAFGVGAMLCTWLLSYGAFKLLTSKPVASRLIKWAQENLRPYEL